MSAVCAHVIVTHTVCTYRFALKTPPSYCFYRLPSMHVVTKFPRANAFADAREQALPGQASFSRFSLQHVAGGKKRRAPLLS
jgi:hypothetical protein